MIKTCPICHQQFKVPPSRANKVHCSRACFTISKNRQTDCIVRCQHCGKKFVTKSYAKRRFCSISCSNSSRARCLWVRCQVCGKVYNTKYAKRGVTKYCSLECLGRAKRCVKWPSAGQLDSLLRQAKVSDVAKMYGVDHTTVRHWCRRLGVRIVSYKEFKSLSKDTHNVCIRRCWYEQV